MVKATWDWAYDLVYVHLLLTVFFLIYGFAFALGISGSCKMENIVDSDVVDENNSHSISIDDNQNSDQESATELKDGLSLDMNCPSGTSMQNEACAYTKAERFTSEVFKIEIGNLPKFFGYGKDCVVNF